TGPEADMPDIRRGNPVQHHDAAALGADQHPEQLPRRFLGSVRRGTWRLLQAADIYLYAGKRNCSGNASDHRLQLRSGRIQKSAQYDPLQSDLRSGYHADRNTPGTFSP